MNATIHEYTPRRYTIEVDNAPNSSGYYTAAVYLADNYVSGGSFVDTDRDAVIEQARAFVAWHRDHDGSREVIEL